VSRGGEAKFEGSWYIPGSTPPLALDSASASPEPDWEPELKLSVNGLVALMAGIKSGTTFNWWTLCINKSRPPSLSQRLFAIYLITPWSISPLPLVWRNLLRMAGSFTSASTSKIDILFSSSCFFSGEEAESSFWRNEASLDIDWSLCSERNDRAVSYAALTPCGKTGCHEEEDEDDEEVEEDGSEEVDW
jgi:hypothetical protein